MLIGKTNMHEFAYGVTTNNPHYGPARNPWDEKRIAGGSSGGSAVALAAGLCFGVWGRIRAARSEFPQRCAGLWDLRQGLAAWT